MKRSLLLSILTVLAINVSAQYRVQGKRQYTQADSTRVVRLLEEARRLKGTPCYMLHFARALKGIPYVGKTLEGNKTEKLVVNLREMDCTTYVENVTALTLCMKSKAYTFNDFCHFLQLIRYQKSLVDYPQRNHYFTQWILSNMQNGTVEEVSQPNPPFTARQTVRVNYMSTHPGQYPMLENHRDWLEIIAAGEKAINGKTFMFIPKAKIDNSKSMHEAVHDGDIIAIVTNKAGLDISHVGIAVWHSDGLHLLNASSIHKKTVEEPMTMQTYMGKHPSQTGIRVVRLQ